MKPSDFRRAQKQVRRIKEDIGKRPADSLPEKEQKKPIEPHLIDISPGQASERVVYQSKPHWVYLARSVLLVIFGLTCTLCTALPVLSEPSPGQPPPPQGMIATFITCATCIFGLAMFSTIQATLHYINTDFILTNRRVLYQTGGLRKRSVEIFIRKVDSVHVQTGFLGRLLGYGTVVVKSGASTQLLANFANPRQIADRINTQITWHQ